MKQMKFKKELYSKVALIKAAYNYTDIAYLHLDADEEYYYVFIEFKNNDMQISIAEFENEMLVQSVRHEVYKQTKTIRELLLARSISTSLITSEQYEGDEVEINDFSEDDILKVWLPVNE